MTKIVQTDKRKGELKMADKRKREKTRNSLSGAQEVTYSREFKRADRAGGYINSKSSH